LAHQRKFSTREIMDWEALEVRVNGLKPIF